LADAEALLGLVAAAEVVPVLELPLVTDPDADPVAVVPELFVLGRTLLIALSQQSVFAPVIPEPDVPEPELVCATARPTPPTRSAAAETAVRREIRMDFSLLIVSALIAAVCKHGRRRSVPFFAAENGEKSRQESSMKV
jgi:hypothetical protein